MRMLKRLKKYFFAHKGNAYKPQILKDTGILTLLVVILTAFAFSALGHYAITRTKLTSLVLSSVLVDYANQDRDGQNYSHLAINPILVKAAQMKADDMAEKGYFAHTSPDGRAPWYWFKQAGYDFFYAGENLAVNFNESTEVNDAWMNSPGHKANIMNDKFTEIGIATAQGLYQGKPTVFVVQLFGKPRNASVSTTKILNQLATSTKAIVSSDAEPKVLSEFISTDSKKPENTQLFIAVKGAESATNTPEATKKVWYSSFIEKLISSPGKFLGLFYLFITLLIVVSLFSFLFIEIKREHTKMIFFAICLIVVMLTLMYYLKIVWSTKLVIV